MPFNRKGLSRWVVLFVAKICFTVVYNNMIKPVQKSKPLFCEQYWKNIAKNTKPVKEYKGRVSTIFDIHDVNNYFIKGSKNIKTLEKQLEMPLNEFIAKTDKEFKQLTPCENSMVLWRGLSAPEKGAKRNPRYEQAYNCKTGDIICMPEYAYATNMDNVALVYAQAYIQGIYPRNGIIYKIHVPKGSRINNSANYIFPRCSKFECLGAQDVTEKRAKYRLITLRYLQPKEIKLNFFEKIIRCFKK